MTYYAELKYSSVEFDSICKSYWCDVTTENVLVNLKVASIRIKANERNLIPFDELEAIAKHSIFR